MTPPRLMEQVRSEIRARHYSRRTEISIGSGASSCSMAGGILGSLAHRRSRRFSPGWPSNSAWRHRHRTRLGVPRIVATLLYGAGLRLQECLELRVKDLDFERREITVRCLSHCVRQHHSPILLSFPPGEEPHRPVVGVFTRSAVAMKQALPGAPRHVYLRVPCNDARFWQIFAATGIGSERCRMPTDSRIKTADATARGAYHCKWA
jgi:hypothetical protein